MAEISNKDCTACKLHKGCPNVCLEGKGDFTAPLMIIKSMPNEKEAVSGVFSDEKLLDAVLFEVIGAKVSDIYKTHILKCAATDAKVSSKEVTACSHYLWAEIKRIKPKAILAIGDLALKQLGFSGTLAKKRGLPQVMDVIIDGEAFNIPVIATYDSAYVDANQKYLNVWAKDVLKAYNLSKGIVNSNSPTKLVYCDDFDKIRQLVTYIKQVGLAVFDYETVEIDDDKGTFHEDFYATCLSFSFQAGSGYVIPLYHKDSPYTKEEADEIMLYLKKHVFENPKIRKVAQNIMFDAHVCRVYGIELRGRLDDTMLMHHLWDETKRHGLKEIVEDFYPEYAGYDDELKGFNWADVPLMMLCQYAATDTDFTYRIMVALESYLQEDVRVYRIYRNLTMAAFKALFAAECRGMLVDVQFLSEAIREVDTLIQRQTIRLRNNKVVKRFEDYNREAALRQAIEEQEEKLENWRASHKSMTVTERNMVTKLADLKSGKIVPYTGINFGSPKQLQDLLYFSPEGFEFSSLDTSTGQDVIKELPDTTGFVEGLLNLRSLEKTQSTYLQGLYRRVDENGRVHTSFKLAGTASGRLSSANPNLQNMPNVAKLKDETLIHAVGLVKKAFIVPDNHKLFQFDYSQAELRIIASFAKEKNMLEVYKDNGDIHSKTGSELINIEMKDFDHKNVPEHKAARSKAKAVNFGLIYGMGAAGFQDYAKNQYGVVMTLEEAEQTRDLFFETYPRLLDYHENYIDKARKYGWVRTLYGRRRRTPDINNEDGFKRGMDERVAINSPIQGTAGEFTIFAVALLHNRLDPRVQFVNTIHDSILFYVPNGMEEYALSVVKDTMQNLPNMQYFGVELSNVGMGADAEASDISWKDLKEL